jgi:hypothetical protein
MYKSFPPKPSRDAGEKSSLDKAIQSGTKKNVHKFPLVYVAAPAHYAISGAPL